MGVEAAPARVSTDRRARPDRRVTLPVLLGAGLAVAAFLVVLMNGHLSLLQEPPLAHDFYDVQAHSLLGLHWDVPRSSLFFEGFLVNGKVYMYFGPVPALLRFPVAAITDQLDGRLGQISMLVAFIVALTFTVRLSWRVRQLVRPDAPVTRGESWAIGGFTLLVGAGSVLVFLASRSWAFHEAEIWGAAFALGSLEFVVAFTLDPKNRNLALASLFAALALLTRVSVGLGPLAALGLLFVAMWWPRTRRLVGFDAARPAKRLAIPLALAILVPVALALYVNYAKFGTLVSLPWKAEFHNLYIPIHRRVLAENGGSLIGLKFIPTTVVQYLRPDLLRFSTLFPFVWFVKNSPRIGGVLMESTWSSSATATMPALSVLAATGLYHVARPFRAGRPRLSPLRAAVVGSFAASVATLAYAYIAHRYVADFLPVMVLLSLVTLHVLLAWSARRGRVPRVRFAWTGLIVLVVASLWFNIGLGIAYGRALEPGVTRKDLVAFVGFQYRLHDLFPGGAAPGVGRGDRLPARAHDGTSFVVGPCGALYWRDGPGWRLLERGPSGGAFRFKIRFPDTPTDWEPLIVNRSADRTQSIDLKVLPGNRVVFAYNVLFEAPEVEFVPGRTYTLDVVMDAIPGSPTRGLVRIALDGRTVWTTELPNKIIDEPLAPLRDVTVGEGQLEGVAPRFTGNLEQVPASLDLCHRLVEASGARGSPAHGASAPKAAGRR